MSFAAFALLLYFFLTSFSSTAKGETIVFLSQPPERETKLVITDEGSGKKITFVAGDGSESVLTTNAQMVLKNISAGGSRIAAYVATESDGSSAKTYVVDSRGQTVLVISEPTKALLAGVVDRRGPLNTQAPDLDVFELSFSPQVWMLFFYDPKTGRVVVGPSRHSDDSWGTPNDFFRVLDGQEVLWGARATRSIPLSPFSSNDIAAENAELEHLISSGMGELPFKVFERGTFIVSRNQSSQHQYPVFASSNCQGAVNQ